MRHLFFLILVFTLMSCGGQPFQPVVEKNYNIKSWPIYEKNWRAKYEEGQNSVQAETYDLKNSTNRSVVRWRNHINSLQGQPALYQLESVHNYVSLNVFEYGDYEHWNRSDKWGYPLETLIEGGDCEDIAILKMLSLTYLGWPEDVKYILVGESTYNVFEPVGHAILLVVLEDGSQVLLDNLQPTILAPDDDHFFQPMFALTKDHMYLVTN